MVLDRTRPPAYSQTFNLSIREAETRFFGQTPVHLLRAGEQDVVKIEVLFPGAGSRMDDKIGESYLTWKLLSQGTPTRTAEEISSTFDQYGGFIEHSPSLDTPSFTLFCLNRHLDKLLPVLEDVIKNASFPEDEFELNRTIAREQMRVQNSKNNVFASKLFRQKLFGEVHPYGKIMEEEHLDALVPADISGFYHTHGKYPEILISGKLEDRQVEAVGQLFARENKGGANEVSIRQGITTPEEFYLEKEKSVQTSLRIGLETIRKDHPDFISLKIATHALGGYFGSRLMKNIREDKGYTYGIYSSLVALENATYFIIGTDVQKEFYKDAIREIHKEIAALADEPLTVTELQMVKNHLLGSFQSSITSPFSLADKFKGVYLHGMDYSYYQQFVNRIQEITGEEIQEMMHRYLPSDKMLHVGVG
jgi:predicted Zn-dependent peptidase